MVNVKGSVNQLVLYVKKYKNLKEGNNHICQQVFLGV